MKHHSVLSNPAGAGFIIEFSDHTPPLYLERSRPKRIYSPDRSQARVFSLLDGAQAAASRLDDLEDRLTGLSYVHRPFPRS